MDRVVGNKSWVLRQISSPIVKFQCEVSDNSDFLPQQLLCGLGTGTQASFGINL